MLHEGQYDVGDDPAPTGCQAIPNHQADKG